MGEPTDQRQAAPADRPAYGLPAQLTLRAGTFLTALLGQTLSTDHNQPGDPFVATLAQPVVVDGVVVAERGQALFGRVAEVRKQTSGSPSRLGLQITSITLADGNQIPIRSQLISRSGTSTPGEVQAGTVVGTTAVGAAIGGAVGWGTGAAIGAGAGALAGLAGVLLTRNHPTIVYPETALTFAVEAPVLIMTVRSPQAFRFVGPEDFNGPTSSELRPRPGPRPGFFAAPAPYPYPYAPYPYWGPSVGVVIGGGWGWGRPGYYRGWGRWR
jgi:hypothetical protein